MFIPDPILSSPNDAVELDLGSSKLIHRIRSDQTGGTFSVVEFVSQPGEGVGLHVHDREEELVYLLEGEIDVALGEASMTVSEGACALLPRGIPHGFVNKGKKPSRLLAILLPGTLDQFFVRLNELLGKSEPREEAIAALCEEFGLRFVAEQATN